MKYKLKDICTKITDGSHNPPSGIQYSQYLMLSSKNIADDSITFDNPRYLTEDDFITENKRTNIQLGDLLLTIVGTVGRVAVVSATTSQICLQRSVAVLKPRQDIVNSRYLMYHLQYIRPTLEAEAKGVAQKGIYLKQVENIEVSIPAITTQIEIINTLDTVSELISLRKQQLSKLDELVKSRFVELFGDCDNKECLGNVATFIKTGKLDANAEDKDGSYPFFTCDSVPKKINQYAFDMEAILISGNGSQVGHIHYYKGKFNAYQRTYVVGQFSSDYDVRFLQTYLKMELKPYIMKNKKGSAIPYITLPMLQNFSVPKPSIELQEQFATFVEQTDKSKFEIQKSLEKLETLKKALMQKYFG